MRSPDRATALPGEEEPELSQTGLRRRGENPANRHRKATVTAPLLDSTHRLSALLSTELNFALFGTKRSPQLGPFRMIPVHPLLMLSPNPSLAMRTGHVQRSTNFG